MVGLRKAVKSKDEEMAGMRSIIADLEEKNQESLRKVQDVEKRIAEVETQKPSSAAAASGGGGVIAAADERELRERLTQQTVDLQMMRNELEVSRRENRTLKKGGASGISDEDMNNLRKVNRDLANENSSLKKELAAFDLEFFEEIENLKFEHAQAIRKLQRLE